MFNVLTSASALSATGIAAGIFSEMATTKAINMIMPVANKFIKAQLKNLTEKITGVPQSDDSCESTPVTKATTPAVATSVKETSAATYTLVNPRKSKDMVDEIWKQYKAAQKEMGSTHPYPELNFLNNLKKVDRDLWILSALIDYQAIKPHLPENIRRAKDDRIGQCQQMAVIYKTLKAEKSDKKVEVQNGQD
jgi:hypothetical protein